MGLYRKKPVVIEARQFTGGWDNGDAILDWMMETEGHPDSSWVQGSDFVSEHMTITTLEGQMRADLGDYIIRGVSDEFYPCKPDIFDATYEAVR